MSVFDPPLVSTLTCTVTVCKAILLPLKPNLRGEHTECQASAAAAATASTIRLDPLEYIVTLENRSPLPHFSSKCRASDILVYA